MKDKTLLKVNVLVRGNSFFLIKICVTNEPIILLPNVNLERKIVKGKLKDVNALN